MKTYYNALAELFKLAAMHNDTLATANLARLLELTSEPVAALAHWSKCKGSMYRIADTLTMQEIDDGLANLEQQQ